MDTKVNENELIKARSDYLRGTLSQSLADNLTGGIAADDIQLGKFHGFYQQDDRDIRQDRQEKWQEPYYSFMLRARLPGGVCTPKQWLTINSIGAKLANGVLRLTTRQTFQYHGILKKNLKPLIQEINQAMIDSIGGCGDVNRNVMANPNPVESDLHQEVYQWAKRISEHLLPHTHAYHELWLDGEKVEGPDDEPLYGETYLPRKFKTAVAIPPHNDVDVYTNDLGFIAIANDGKLIGFNVIAGGGMGTTHGDTSTYPQLAQELGFIEPKDVLAVAAAVVEIQRDHGDRLNRRQARLKYTIHKMGLGTFRGEVQKRSGVLFGVPWLVKFIDHGDRYGWVKGAKGDWHLTLFIENGRIVDTPEKALSSGLEKIAEIHQGDFRITPNQNLIIAGISNTQKHEIEAIAVEHGLLDTGVSRLRLNGIACVSLPTCPQAMAEAERYFPAFMDKVDGIAQKHDLADINTVIRMTGCPNGCARPFVAEIGLVGKGPGRYNLMLGGDGLGSRINKLYQENLNEKDLLSVLDDLFGRYAKERNSEAERFGDFVIRAGIIEEVIDPSKDYHA